MKSWLIVEHEQMDATTIAKHLQIRGVVSGLEWRFNMPGRLLERAIARHVQHWSNLLQKHAEGRRALQRLGYHFSLHFSSGNDLPIAFTRDEVDLIARVRCGVVIENHDSTSINTDINKRIRYLTP